MLLDNLTELLLTRLELLLDELIRAHRVLDFGHLRLEIADSMLLLRQPLFSQLLSLDGEFLNRILISSQLILESFHCLVFLLKSRSQISDLLLKRCLSLLRLSLSRFTNKRGAVDRLVLNRSLLPNSDPPVRLLAHTRPSSHSFALRSDSLLPLCCSRC